MAAGPEYRDWTTELARENELLLRAIDLQKERFASGLADASKRLDEAVEAIKGLLEVAKDVPDCSHCDGHAAITVDVSRDPAIEDWEPVECQECFGTGKEV